MYVVASVPDDYTLGIALHMRFNARTTAPAWEIERLNGTRESGVFDEPNCSMSVRLRAGDRLAVTARGDLPADWRTTFFSLDAV